MSLRKICLIVFPAKFGKKKSRGNAETIDPSIREVSFAGGSLALLASPISRVESIAPRYSDRDRGFSAAEPSIPVARRRASLGRASLLFHGIGYPRRMVRATSLSCAYRSFHLSPARGTKERGRSLQAKKERTSRRASSRRHPGLTGIARRTLRDSSD